MKYRIVYHYYDPFSVTIEGTEIFTEFLMITVPEEAVSATWSASRSARFMKPDVDSKITKCKSTRKVNHILIDMQLFV